MYCIILYRYVFVTKFQNVIIPKCLFIFQSHPFHSFFLLRHINRGRPSLIRGGKSGRFEVSNDAVYTEVHKVSSLHFGLINAPAALTPGKESLEPIG
jgi:hypothetical protein